MVVQVDAIAVTVGPGLEICLRVGCTMAKDLATQHHKPFVTIHHLEVRTPDTTLTCIPLGGTIYGCPCLFARLSVCHIVTGPLPCLLFLGAHADGSVCGPECAALPLPVAARVGGALHDPREPGRGAAPHPGRHP